jgi:predicted HTH transcriptional regulator
MTNPQEYLLRLVNELLLLTREMEWVEFKHNNADPQEIGEYISALANSAALAGKAHGYLVWGIDAKTHNILGTSFRPKEQKIGNEEMENWLLRLLSPKINFYFHVLMVEHGTVVILEIDRASRHPVRFRGIEYIRVGSYKKPLKEFPEKERQLWRIFDITPFEELHAAEKIATDEVLRIIDYPSYFELIGQPLPDNKKGILERLSRDNMISIDDAGTYSITNLGAVLFAKKLDDFKSLKRKAVRVVVYNGATRLETIKEQIGGRGYASGFGGLIEFINGLIPRNEIIGKALRKDVPMYPEIAVRELVANAIIHQDFSLTGTGPMVEIFGNRMEITNPGVPLVETTRFLDSPPRSRNEKLASFLRRVGICEERGSGIDKVVFQTELFQLPAPLFEKTSEHTRATLFAHKRFRDMDKQDRIRACYLHACLRYVNRDFMTNSSIRSRFGVETHNSATASRIIRDTVEAGLVRQYDPEQSRKYAKYVPFWA